MTELLSAVRAGTARAALFEDVRTGAARSVKAHPARVHWPELDALARTPQDPGWHAEGDVLVHTDMVLAASETFEAELEREDDRALVRLACLLHDIAKPVTTRFDDEVQRVIARGHERMGGVAVRHALHQSGLGGAERRMLSELVATHHLVKRTVKRADDPESAAMLDRLATRVDTRLLWALEAADMRGRICEDHCEQQEIVALFRMLCEERGVFGAKPARWVDREGVRGVRAVSERALTYALDEAHRRRLEGSVRDRWQAEALVHELAREEPAEVIVTIGVSGSGKSHAIERLPPDWVRIAPDEWRAQHYGSAEEQGDPAEVHRACREQLKAVLRARGRAVYDGTNVVADLRAHLVSLCHAYRARLSLWVFDVDPERARARNAARDRVVPAWVIDRQLAKFEWPSPEEAHEIKIIED